MAAEGSHLKIHGRTFTHIVFTEKTKLRNLGEPRVLVSEKYAFSCCKVL